MHRRHRKTTYKLSDEEGTIIVKLARYIIEKELRINKKPIIEKIPEKLKEERGVFVTLNKQKVNEIQLRGCIGLPYPVKPLIEAIKEAAFSAAFKDYRFPPVSASEMKNILVEVSVLTPPEPIIADSPEKYPTKIETGKDGLIIGRGLRKGLLLPQVAVDWEWDSIEFLIQCCFKAGLPPDAWMMKGTEVLKFQAIIFAEKEPNGEIKRHS